MNPSTNGYFTNRSLIINNATDYNETRHFLNPFEVNEYIALYDLL